MPSSCAHLLINHEVWTWASPSSSSKSEAAFIGLSHHPSCSIHVLHAMLMWGEYYNCKLQTLLSFSVWHCDQTKHDLSCETEFHSRCFWIYGTIALCVEHHDMRIRGCVFVNVKWSNMSCDQSYSLMYDINNIRCEASWTIWWKWKRDGSCCSDVESGSLVAGP